LRGFVYVQERVAELAQTAIDYRPMQALASFDLDVVKAQVEDAIKARQRRNETCECATACARSFQRHVCKWPNATGIVV
jgi:hypothetical protein